MSEYIYKGKVPTAFIDEALEAYRLYKADRDPLNQRGTVGWKSYRFFKILEQTKMLRIESIANLA